MLGSEAKENEITCCSDSDISTGQGSFIMKAPLMLLLTQAVNCLQPAGLFAGSLAWLMLTPQVPAWVLLKRECPNGAREQGPAERGGPSGNDTGRV